MTEKKHPPARSADGTSAAPPRTRRRWWWWLAAAAAAVIAIAVLGFVVWGLTPSQPTDTALAALQSGDGVTVTQVDGGWTFVPSTEPTAPAAGLVIYPGGHVDARAYATYARAVAQKGYVVAIAKVPLSLAFFKIDAADEFIGAPEFADIDLWAVAGHSLGGVAAARYAADNLEAVRGIVLLASYPDSAADLSRSALVAGDVTASVDGVLDWANWEAAKPLLPADTTFTSIEGGNHAQFGDYGSQKGDNPAEIPAEDQRAQAASATADVLSRLVGAD